MHSQTNRSQSQSPSPVTTPTHLDDHPNSEFARNVRVKHRLGLFVPVSKTPSVEDLKTINARWATLTPDINASSAVTSSAVTSSAVTSSAVTSSAVTSSAVTSSAIVSSTVANSVSEVKYDCYSFCTIS